MIKRLACIYLFSFVILMSMAAGAQDLHVVTEDYAPYNYSENGEIVGFSTEVLRAILKRAEVGYQIEMLPWARAYRIAQGAKGVLIYSMARTPERENQFHWVGPLAPRSVHLFRLATRRDIAPKTDAELTGYRMGVVRADATEALALGWGFVPDKNLMVAKDIAQLLRLLDAGRIDVVPANPLMFQHDLKRDGRNAADYPSCYSVNFDDGYYLGISRGSNPRLIERIRKAFDALSKEGVLDQIRSRYEGLMFK
ncbi:substrate-binding periplasmic protein [Desulfovibrio ferrophilus]|uniref:Solute-binding protein family 3/N-terminal domain-containing protein n=1 Tax=Desulfovibrio ferrophilus TaxID=241368 RepID=A0A2Z6B2J2_9BACT|nr:transporter substrate-binding domain-containing protein [Desulfovibrio ferrophilus]BBD09712.1 uncharacterized protein DFE_2986 [Desulfovibrio ferrophilus]